VYTHDTLLTERIVPWALESDEVRGIAELGSRSGAAPVDEWADMDLLLLVRDTAPFVEADDWLDHIAPRWVALTHPGPFEDLAVRQILFEGALDFDMVPMEAGTLGERIKDPAIAFALGGGFRGGFRPLVDKDGEIAALDLPERPAVTALQVTASDFDFVVNDFLFQVVWACKHLRRGEVWAAKDDVDSYMKGDLVRMIEWDALARDPTRPTRGGGRYLEEWADPAILARLAPTFATYHPASVATALLELMEVFKDVAEGVARRLNLEYPASSHQQVLGWARDCLRPFIEGPGQGETAHT
jgi:aminoglycoside 6-adenylyltransferase